MTFDGLIKTEEGTEHVIKDWNRKDRKKRSKWVADQEYFFIFAPRKQGIDLWCNGSTADFGSVSLGSNPGRSTTEPSPKREGFLFYIPRLLKLHWVCINAFGIQ